jgi:hypothetical protein
VRSGRDRGVGVDLEALQAEQVVAVLRAPIRVQAPAGEAPPREDHASAPVSGTMMAVTAWDLFDADNAVLGEAAHAEGSCEFLHSSAGLTSWR